MPGIKPTQCWICQTSQVFQNGTNFLYYLIYNKTKTIHLIFSLSPALPAYILPYCSNGQAMLSHLDWTKEATKIENPIKSGNFPESPYSRTNPSKYHSQQWGFSLPKPVQCGRSTWSQRDIKKKIPIIVVTTFYLYSTQRKAEKDK